MKRSTNPTVHAGALKHAIRLLRWWAKDGTDEPVILEMMKQSKECARDLAASLRRYERQRTKQSQHSEVNPGRLVIDANLDRHDV